ncbi:MAG: alkaline phosphatase D family protein [Bacteroidota bacterium]
MIKQIIFLFFICLTIACSNFQGDSILTSNDPFQTGVASGDPDQNSVVLWTKLSPDHEIDSIPILFYISRDSSKIFEKGESYFAHKESDFAFKITAEDLKAGTTYYYAFSTGQHKSKVGRTKTLPSESETIKLAIVSCSHFETGYFNAYKAIAEMEDLNAVVHLGDYIYEGAPAYPDGPRIHEPQHEIVSLVDYRTRYQQYRSDPHLQLLHQTHPMVNIWDDHEIVDNWTKDGSHLHDSLTDGNWLERKKMAKKVFYEWLPTRVNTDKPLYRTFKFGNIASLHMLDTRSYRTGYAKTDDEAEKLEILGSEQFSWLENEFSNSNTTWNILGNQVPVAKMDYYSFYPEWRASGYDKWWKGYPKEYKKLVHLIKDSKKNVLITTGDLHSAFLSHLINEGDTVATELITTSVSSHTWDEGFVDKEVEGMPMLNWVEKQLQIYNPHIEWFDLVNNGFMVLTLSSSQATIDWYKVSTTLEKDFKVTKANSYKIEAKYSLGEK